MGTSESIRDRAILLETVLIRYDFKAMRRFSWRFSNHKNAIRRQACVLIFGNHPVSCPGRLNVPRSLLVVTAVL